jgi:hypothetical protein
MFEAVAISSRGCSNCANFNTRGELHPMEKTVARSSTEVPTAVLAFCSPFYMGVIAY